MIKPQDGELWEQTGDLTRLVLSRFSCVWLFVTPWTVARQAPLSMGFSRQEYGSGVAMPSSRGSSQPRIKARAPISPPLAGGSFATSATWRRHRAAIKQPGSGILSPGPRVWGYRVWPISLSLTHGSPQIITTPICASIHSTLTKCPLCSKHCSEDWGRKSNE